MSEYQDSSDEEYYVEGNNKKKIQNIQHDAEISCKWALGKRCDCQKCRKRTCNCVVLASRGSCSPEDDIPYPKPGQLWIRDTNVMYVYQSEPIIDKLKKNYCNKWLRVPMGKVLDFNFVSTINLNAVSFVQTNGLTRQIVKTFVFPDSFNGWGGRIRKIEYGNSWSEAVDNPKVDEGMLVTIRDQVDKQSVIIAQDKPSQYEAFSTCSEVLYQPNPGDILEVVIQKPPNQSQLGEGRLHCLKIFLSPFNPDPSCYQN